MARVGKLPKIPTPDAFRRALGKVRDVDAKHTETEIVRFSELVRSALNMWPADVPRSYLTVHAAAYGTPEDPNRSLAVLQLKDGVFEAIEDDHGVMPGETDVHAMFTDEEAENYANDLIQSGWQMAGTVITGGDGSSIKKISEEMLIQVWRPVDEVIVPGEAAGESPVWARTLAPLVKRAANTAARIQQWFIHHPDEDEHPITLRHSFDEHITRDQIERSIDGEYRPHWEAIFDRILVETLSRELGNVGLNADWSVNAWMLEGADANRSDGGVYVTHEDGPWDVIQRFYGEEPLEDEEDPFEDGVHELLTFNDVMALHQWAIDQDTGPAGEDDLSKEALRANGIEPPRDNPSCSYFVNDGTTEHGPFTLEQMCANNAEHADLCEAMKALEPGGELQVGGGGDAAFVIRCEGEARDNPEHGEDGHEHSIECGEVPPDDEYRINPVSERDMQSILDHLSTEAATEVHRCLSLFGMGDYIEQGRVEVSFSMQFVSSMGRCAYRHRRDAVITLNAMAWPRVSEDERLATLRHEAAHAVDYLKNGSSSHGPRWNAIARKMGDNAERTHDARDVRTGIPISHVVRAETGRGRRAPREMPSATEQPVGGWRVGDHVSFTSRRGEVISGRIKTVNDKTVTLDNRWRVSPQLLRRARANPDEGGGDDAIVCKQHGWRHAPDQECEKCVEDRGARANPEFDGRAFYFDWGSDDSGPYSINEAIQIAPEHADELVAMRMRDEVEIGGRLVKCTRSNWTTEEAQTASRLAVEASRANPSGDTRVQSLAFDAASFTTSSAKKWAKARGFKASKCDERDNTIRIRQDDPGAFARESFRTITLAEGVQAVIGLPRD